MKYKGIVQERKLWVKVAIFILAVYMLYRSIATHQWVYAPILILVMLACFFSKEQVVSEEGVDIEYTLFKVFKTHNYWRWNEITTIHTDYRKARPNVMLHIGKDVVTRSFIMNNDDCQGAVQIAARMNPEIFIENLTPEEQEKRDYEILHRQEVLRAKKAAKRRKK